MNRKFYKECLEFHVYLSIYIYIYSSFNNPVENDKCYKLLLMSIRLKLCQSVTLTVNLFVELDRRQKEIACDH